MSSRKSIQDFSAADRQQGGITANDETVPGKGDDGLLQADLEEGLFPGFHFLPVQKDGPAQGFRCAQMHAQPGSMFEGFGGAG
jgi:hypothetical protein